MFSRVFLAQRDPIAPRGRQQVPVRSVSDLRPFKGDGMDGRYPLTPRELLSCFASTFARNSPARSAPSAEIV